MDKPEGATFLPGLIPKSGQSNAQGELWMKCCPPSPSPSQPPPPPALVSHQTLDLDLSPQPGQGS